MALFSWHALQLHGGRLQLDREHNSTGTRAGPPPDGALARWRVARRTLTAQVRARPWQLRRRHGREFRRRDPAPRAGRMARRMSNVRTEAVLRGDECVLFISV